MRLLRKLKILHYTFKILYYVFTKIASNEKHEIMLLKIYKCNNIICLYNYALEEIFLFSRIGPSSPLKIKQTAILPGCS